MKKVLYILLFLSICIIIKFYISSYKINYVVDNISVMEKYKKNTYYFEFKDKNNNKFNMKINSKRYFSKKLISKIDIITENKNKCYYPQGKIKNQYPICFDKNSNLISYDLILEGNIKEFINSLKIFNEQVLDKSNIEFKYYDNIKDNISIAIWKYNGFYLLNKDEIKAIDIFTSGRYGNDFSIMINNYIFMPNYDSDLIFDKFVVFDIISGEFKKYKTKHKISYGSYIVGKQKNSIYLFDNKSYNLYSINIKNGKVKLVGNKTNGYIKIVNGRKVSAELKDYKVKKIKYNTKKQNEDISIKNNTYSFKENPKIKTKFTNKKEIKVVGIIENDIYYLENDNLYMFSPKTGNEILVHYFELNFNDENRVFVYYK